jgi:hypothetical protein
MGMQADTTGQARGPRKISVAGLGLRTLGLWVTVLVASVVASKFVPVNLPVPRQDGPLSVMGAFLVVNGLISVALSFVAARARVSGWRLAVLLFIAFFGIGSAMMQIETLYFNESIKMPIPVIGDLVAQAAIVGVIVATAGAAIFRPSAVASSPVPARLMTRVLALAVVYFLLYWGAGYFIAWQSEAVRAYYANGIHIDPLRTMGLQLVRGLLFALISLYIVTRIEGSLVCRAAIMAVLFAALTAPQLLYPNPLVPWTVRQVHLLEVGSSEFVYGILATLILLGGAARKPLAETSPWRLITGRA